jgi:hypothetical protein
MERSVRFERHDMGRVWISAAVLFVTQIATSLLVRRSAPSERGVLAAASMTAIAIIGVALLNAPSVPYRRWAYGSTAAILACAVLASPMVAGSATAWVRLTRDMLWTLPWYLVLLAILPAPKRGVCAPESPWSARLMVGSAVVLGASLLIAGRL